MSRIIKFRSWDGLRHTYWPELRDWNTEFANFDDDIIIEQFTGLLDKNGKEIYESDKIRDSDIGIFVVKFGETFELMGKDGYYGWYLEVFNFLHPSCDKNVKVVQLNSSISFSGEVIGNIHEPKEGGK